MNKLNIISIHQIGLPITFENIIPEDDSVRLLYDVTEGLDYIYNSEKNYYVCASGKKILLKGTKRKKS